MSTAGGAIGISSTSDELAESTIQNIERDSKISDPNDASINLEKGEAIVVESTEENALLLSHKEQFPVDPNETEETQQFTVRAVLVGCILGGVIAASKSG